MQRLLNLEYIATNIKVPLDAMLSNRRKALRRVVSRAVGVDFARIGDLRVVRKSVDARKKNAVHFVVSCTFRLMQNGDVDSCDLEHSDTASGSVMGLSSKWPYKVARGVSVREHEPFQPPIIPDLSKPFEESGNLRPIVIGAGPAGLFCALWLARAGMQPIVIERGQAVEQRQQTVLDFASGGDLDPNSNIQFGEGGAGAFSDGKLTCGKNDPHIRAVLHDLVAAGAPQDILVDAKPHIGTDYLPSTVRGIREAIQRAGGEFRFETQLVGLSTFTETEAVREGGCAASEWPTEAPDGPNASVIATFLNRSTSETYDLMTDSLVLAIGHSARDTLQMMLSSGAAMQRKPFAVGVRIEHPQELIDRIQYGKSAGHPALPPADYKLAVRTQDDRGVYTFCMCPGGEVVAASSEPDGICVNGMSNHARDGKNANSALLVEVRPEDLSGSDVLEGIRFQRDLEHSAYQLGASFSRSYVAPAQTVGGFLSNASCEEFVHPTYPRGVAWTDLRQCLPKFVSESIAEALPKMDSKLHGFADPQAVLTAVEARSSSPVRIMRDRATLQSTSLEGVFPAGEGAGYAGGIMSAATDGIRVAQAIMRRFALRQTQADLLHVADRLLSSHVAVFDTETVAGLGLAVQHSDSLRPLYILKGRSEDKPISWLVDSPSALTEYGEDVPKYAKELSARFWPGPLTLIVRANAQAPSGFVSPSRTLGMRMPDSPDVLALISQCGPLATTSANLTGDPAPSSIHQVDPVLMLRAGCTLAHGRAPVAASADGLHPPDGSGDPQVSSSGIASTVVDCTGGAPKILREGSITAADIKSALLYSTDSKKD